MACSKKKGIDRVQSEEKPKKLSKLGEWMLANKGGIIEVHDWKAVNR